jgi:CSLREA domain-containing protein
MTSRVRFAPATVLTALLLLGSPALAQEKTFVVNDTGDESDATPGDGECNGSGDAGCTLRAAVEEANAFPNADVDTPDRIHFAIIGPAPHTIAPASGLPEITEPVVIDGTTEPDFVTTPVIVINGTDAGAVDGLVITSGHCTILGLVIQSFEQDGIFIFDGPGNHIEGNFIGTNVTGMITDPDGAPGTGDELGNGQAGVGILISEGNVIGGLEAEKRNLISGNLDGVAISNSLSTNNTVHGNFIGTDAAGTAALPNSRNGVLLTSVLGTDDYASDNLIGGAVPGAMNLISGNGIVGVEIFRGTANRVEGNHIGVDITGEQPLGNEFGVVIDEGVNNRIGGTADGAGNVISGNAFFGVQILADDRPATHNRVQGNHIGPDEEGRTAVPNLRGGVSLQTRSGATAVVMYNTIGGTDDDDGELDGDTKARNVISGNGEPVSDPSVPLANGVSLLGTGVMQNSVDGNYIGVDVTGLLPLGNTGNGVLVSEPVGQPDDVASNNFIGAANAGGGNVISANGRDGIQIAFGSTSNFVLNNFIGTDSTGAVVDPDEEPDTGDELGNARHGVAIFDSQQNVVGFGVEAARNVISGNGECGVFIGLGAAGVDADENLVHGNSIGTDTEGALELGNGDHGVRVDGGDNNEIGGPFSNQGNAIAFNGHDLTQSGHAVVVADGIGNRVLSNAVYKNAGRGIDLGDDSFTINDVDAQIVSPGASGNCTPTLEVTHDDDEGANGLQNFPVVTAVGFGDVYKYIEWTLRTKPGTYVIQFFANSELDPSGFGEGERFLGITEVTTDADGLAQFSVVLDRTEDLYISTTATDDQGNTSEFSMVDTDGDALADAWELLGADTGFIDINEDGTPDLVLLSDPDHKDLFVEVDAMGLHAPTQATLDMVAFGRGIPGTPDGFANAPAHLVRNPDGDDGINLHATLDEATMHSFAWTLDLDGMAGNGVGEDVNGNGMLDPGEDALGDGLDDGDCADQKGWPFFDAMKSTPVFGGAFGTASERNDPNAEHILAAKRLVYRYCMFADHFPYPNGPGMGVELAYSGIAEIGGNDLIVSLGKHGGIDAKKQAGTFMHELGHTLNLRHGGADGTHHKPNYHSVMNYTWQLDAAWMREMGASDYNGDGDMTDEVWSLNYSEVRFGPLFESNLDEAAGICFPHSQCGVHSHHWTLAGPPPAGPVREFGAVDWNRNGGVPNEAGVAEPGMNTIIAGDVAVSQPLVGHEDWSKLKYYYLEEPEFIDGIHNNATGDALTLEQALEMDSLGDSAGIMQLPAVSIRVEESQIVEIVVSRGNGTQGTVTVDYTTADGSATAGQDYAALSGTLTFNSGEFMQTIAVTVADDGVDEPTETFRFTLSNPTGGATVNERSAGVISIYGSDGPGIINFNTGVFHVGEARGTAAIDVIRSGGSLGAVSVDYTTADGSAQAGLDYTATSGTLTFADGETETQVQIAVSDDTELEHVETVLLALSNPTGGAVLGAPDAARLKIHDEVVAAPIVQFQKAIFDVIEGAGQAVITVIRTGPTTAAISVDYDTSDDSAIAGEDYTPVSGTLEFAAGEALATFDVPIFADALDEELETVDLSLSNPTGDVQIGGLNTAVMWIVNAEAPPLIVNTTDDVDDGACTASHCSLREAILAANTNAGAETVSFDIPGPGVHTITPSSALPQVIETLTIDGYTQPGATVNTSETGTNAVLLVELSGRVLEIRASDCTIRGLVINSASGISVRDANQCTITGNFIGTDASGTVGFGNGAGCLLRDSSGHQVGGADIADRNLLSANGNGLTLSNVSASRIQGNLIGTAADGQTPLGNGSPTSPSNRGGVLVSGDNNLIGGTEPGEGNVIAFNSIQGVVVIGGQHNAIRGNAIWGNAGVWKGGLGITLASGGLTPDVGRNTLNDAGDADTGSNGLQNYPRLTSAQQAGGLLSLGGVLGSTADSTFEIDVFLSDAPDPGGYGEARYYLGTFDVTTESDGLAWFEAELAANVVSGQVITTTATSQAGDTSEFSERIAVGDPLVDPFVVNTVDDSDDGWCDAVHCSLREAIHAANLSLGHDDIVFDIPGAGVHTILPELMLPVLTDPVTVDGYTQPGAGPNTLADGIDADLRIEIAGTEVPFAGFIVGLESRGGDSIVRGLVINRFNSVNLLIADGSNNLVAGNFLGCDPTGLLGYAARNGYGVELRASSDNLIGGLTPESRNLASGGRGVRIFASTALAKEANSANVVQNNYIGTDRHGLAVIGNDGGGVSVEWGTGHIIGGVAGVAGNVIAGNNSSGVFLGTVDHTVVKGNYVGTDRTGTAALGNRNGIIVRGSGNTIGGVAPGEGNIVAACETEGLTVTSDIALEPNVVQGNYIGTNAFSDVGLGNGRVGVRLRGTSWVGGMGTLVGGLESGAGNTIAYNGDVGVRVEWVGNNLNFFNTGNTFLSNRMFANTNLGIDLISANGGIGLCPICSDGPLLNDAGDFDNGHNRLQNTPVLRNAAIDAAGDLTIEYEVDTSQAAVYPLLVELFRADAAGLEGEILLGRDTYELAEAQAIKVVNLGPAATLGFEDGQRLVATATDTGGNTSEFSFGLADLSVAVVDDPDPIAAGESLTLDVSAVNDGPFLADDVDVSIILPAGFVAGTVTPAAPTCLLDGNTVECQFIRMAADATFDVEITGTAQAGGTLVTSATIASGTEDPDPSNNEASADTTVDGNIDDCAGVRGGIAIVDICGVCAGGTTGVEPDTDVDCAGVCFGSAAIDTCGVCAGGVTGIELDADVDCAGECFGSAVPDSCGICSGGTTGHVADSDTDCSGFCFGAAFIDACNVCAGGDTGLIPDADLDCAGVCFGSAFIDECGQCAGGTSGHEPNSDQDCNDDCFGTAFIDACGICAGGTTGITPSLPEDCAIDCAGIVGGSAFVDDCSVCAGGTTGHMANSDQDCAGACFGTAFMDDCAVCSGGTTSDAPDSDMDCAGDCFGSARLDTCGICAGGSTGIEPDRDLDCAGICFGSAIIDSCGVCAGGTTGHLADSDQDCAGVCFGVAVLDSCGVCAGGTTGQQPNADIDCHGDCFGGAVVDACGVCVGGNTGIPVSSAEDCASVVPIDILPGACPNRVRTSDHSVVIAILGTTEMPVAYIATHSITITRTDGVGTSVSLMVASERRRYQDVATPFEGETCACNSLTADGWEDLVLYASTEELYTAFQLAALPPATSIEFILEGTFVDGSALAGADCLGVLPDTGDDSDSDSEDDSDSDSEDDSDSGDDDSDSEIDSDDDG